MADDEDAAAVEPEAPVPAPPVQEPGGLGGHLVDPLRFIERGPALPGFRRILSDPGLRTQYLGIGDPDDHEAQEKRKAEWAERAKQGRTDLELEKLSKALDRAAATRKAERKEHARRRRAHNRMRKEYEMKLAQGRMDHVPPPWTYCDPPGYFEVPQKIDSEGSVQIMYNPQQHGIYGAKGYEPPHNERNVHGGWNFHSRNAKSETLQLFEKIPEHRMSPKEKEIAARLARAECEAKAKHFNDVLADTTGWVRKAKIAKNSQPFSAHKREALHWEEQQISTHTYFSTPAPYKPGEQKYDQDIQHCIEQSRRATDYKLGFFAGQPTGSKWVPPKAGITGSNVRAQKAAELQQPPAVRRANQQREVDKMQSWILAHTRSAGNMGLPEGTSRRSIMRASPFGNRG